MIQLRVTTYGDGERLRGALNGLGNAARDLSPAWPRVIERFRQQETRLWDTEGGSGEHGRWTPLDPAYAKRKAELFARRPILYLSGALHDSLADSGQGSIVQYDNHSLFIGSEVVSQDGYPYGQAHQEGRGLPQRRVIDPTNKDVGQWVAEVWRHFETVTTRVGFRGRLVAAMS